MIFVSKFIENGMSGVSSLMAWVISALCALNKRYNQMEGAAAGMFTPLATASTKIESYNYRLRINLSLNNWIRNFLNFT